MADIAPDRSTTTTLALGQSLESAIDFEQDIDLIRVELTAGQNYVFDLLGVASGLTLGDPVLALMNANMEIVASDDDSGLGLDARIALIAPASGTYYLQASAFEQGIGTYRLTMGAGTDDWGQSIGGAGALVDGTVTTGTIDFIGDRDWFRIDLAAGTNYDFFLRGAALGNGTLRDPQLSLFDSYGTLIDIRDDGVDDTLDSLLSFTPSASGTYYLEASAFDGRIGTYQVSVMWSAVGTGAGSGGSAGDDVLLGNEPPGMLIGGSGYDVFAGTKAELNGEVILGFAAGDRIHIVDGSIDGFTFSLTGDTLRFGDDTITLLGGYSGRLVARAFSSGGVDLVTLEADARSSDINDDFRSDILWRNVNGDLTTWQSHSDSEAVQFQRGAYYTSVDPGWKVAETLDVNGDGATDILWRHSSGVISVWAGTGDGAFAGLLTETSADNGWSIAAAGDFNGDGKDDVLWRADGGDLSVWSSAGTQFLGSYYHAPIDQAWKVAGAGDFNGDGRADILWRHSSGALTTWDSTGESFAGGSFNGTVSNEWHVEGIGDWNGDGKDDLFWHSDRGEVGIWTGQTGGFSNTFYDASVGADWHFAQIGDFNGDGRADILWRHDGGALSVWLADGSSFNKQSFYDASVPTAWGWSIVGHDFM